MRPYTIDRNFMYEINKKLEFLKSFFENQCIFCLIDKILRSNFEQNSTKIIRNNKKKREGRNFHQF